MDVYKEWLGIPEGERPPDHYQLLRVVQFEDDLDKIQNNYRKLNAHVRKYASGKHAVASQELLNEMARAMLCLTDLERKREYDEELGREFEEEQDVLGRRPLLKVLVDGGHISREQSKEVEDYADARGLSHRDAVVQMKLTDAATATQALAVELGHSYVELQNVLPDDSVLDRVPRKTVKRHDILPLFIDDDKVIVACIHEPTHDLEEELRLRFGIPMRGVLATPLDVNQAIAKYYAAGVRDEAVAEQSVAAASKGKKGDKGGGATSSRIPFDQLDPETQAQRKQLGYVFMMWGFVGSVLVDEFIVKPNFIPDNLAFPWVPSITTVVVAPLVIWWVLNRYWK